MLDQRIQAGSHATAQQFSRFLKAFTSLLNFKDREKSTLPPEDDLSQGSHGEKKDSFPQQDSGAGLRGTQCFAF